MQEYKQGKNVKINAVSANYKDKTTKANKSYTITLLLLTIAKLSRIRRRFWDGAEITPVLATASLSTIGLLSIITWIEAYGDVFQAYPTFEVGTKNSKGKYENTAVGNYTIKIATTPAMVAQRSRCCS